MYIAPVVNYQYFNRPISPAKPKTNNLVVSKPAQYTLPSFKATVGDAYAAQIAKAVKEKQMVTKAKVWIDVMTGVANECASHGVSINVDYCKKSPIKNR